MSAVELEFGTEEGQFSEHEDKIIERYIGDRNTLGERHGRGLALLPNNDIYEGQYSHGQRHGLGLYIFKNGARYLGRYRCSVKSGQGIFIYPDGSYYEGNWRKDLKHGHGIYTYPNGDVYKGNWFKGKRHGLGEYLFKDGVRFNGTWRNGIRIGPAEVHTSNYVFHGIWDKKYPQGPGIYSFDCKYMYRGYYALKNKSNYEKKIAYEGEEEEEMNFDEGGEEDMLSKLSDDDGEFPLWYTQDILKYDYSQLPQQPIPLPLSDSEESVCDLSDVESRRTRETSIHEEEAEICPFEDVDVKADTRSTDPMEGLCGGVLL